MKRKLVTLVVEIQALVPDNTSVWQLHLLNKKSDFKIALGYDDIDVEIQRYSTVTVIDNDNKHSDE